MEALLDTEPNLLDAAFRETLYRHTGGHPLFTVELLLMQGDEAETEASFHKAIEVACCQQARSWELRAVMGLSRLWQRQGRQAKACQRLAEVYGWFTEGFDTPDLQEARTLLEELSRS